MFEDKTPPHCPKQHASKQHFPKSCRLRKNADFQQVYRLRNSAADSVLIVLMRPNPNQQGRLGLSVSRKVGNAVTRNRWKRLIREAFRQNCKHFADWDCVVIPQRGCVPPTLVQLQKSLLKLAEKIKKRG